VYVYVCVMTVISRYEVEQISGEERHKIRRDLIRSNRRSLLSSLTYVGDGIILVPHPQASSRMNSLVHKAAKLLVTYTT
jgi:hypothetical protein